MKHTARFFTRQAVSTTRKLIDRPPGIAAETRSAPLWIRQAQTGRLIGRHVAAQRERRCRFRRLTPEDSVE